MDKIKHDIAMAYATIRLEKNYENVGIAVKDKRLYLQFLYREYQWALENYDLVVKENLKIVPNNEVEEDLVEEYSIKIPIITSSSIIKKENSVIEQTAKKKKNFFDLSDLDEDADQTDEEEISTATIESTSKRSIFLLISLLLSSAYLIYIVLYFFGIVGNSSGAEQVGAGLATLLVLPHMLVLLIAVIMNAIGWITNSRPFSLTAGILYSVSAILFIMYAPFLVIQIILSFVGFAKLPKKIKE